jgi:CBS domain-containing protein
MATMAVDRPRVRDLGRLFPLLHGSTLYDIMPKNKVAISVKPTDPIQTVLETLKSNHIHGVLVKGTDTKPEGWIDAVDIMCNILFHSDELLRKKDLRKEGEIFAQHTARDVISK